MWLPWAHKLNSQYQFKPKTMNLISYMYISEPSCFWKGMWLLGDAIASGTELKLNKHHLAWRVFVQHKKLVTFSLKGWFSLQGRWREMVPIQGTLNFWYLKNVFVLSLSKDIAYQGIGQAIWERGFSFRGDLPNLMGVTGILVPAPICLPYSWVPNPLTPLTKILVK